MACVSLLGVHLARRAERRKHLLEPTFRLGDVELSILNGCQSVPKRTTCPAPPPA
jgi:hypothetical protein